MCRVDVLEGGGKDGVQERSESFGGEMLVVSLEYVVALAGQGDDVVEEGDGAVLVLAKDVVVRRCCLERGWLVGIERVVVDVDEAWIPKDSAECPGGRLVLMDRTRAAGVVVLVHDETQPPSTFALFGFYGVICVDLDVLLVKAKRCGHASCCPEQVPARLRFRARLEIMNLGRRGSAVLRKISLPFSFRDLLSGSDPSVPISHAA